jgi:hypothetical protein
MTVSLFMTAVLGFFLFRQPLKLTIL